MITRRCSFDYQVDVTHTRVFGRLRDEREIEFSASRWVGCADMKPVKTFACYIYARLSRLALALKVIRGITINILDTLSISYRSMESSTV